MNLKSIYIVYLTALLLACGNNRQEPVVTPWGVVVDSISASDDFDLADIQGSGEMILLTLNGPEYYYDYRGRHLGIQYLLAERFSTQIGVRLRVEVCRDSVDMFNRLLAGEGDIMASTELGRLVASPKKPDLQHELASWYKPTMLDEVRKQESYILSSRSVKRRVFSPMLDKISGIISHYDGLFMQYSSTIRWDWKLLAAQAYQESTFDPKAVSFAGAKGLMQIMPSTADHLGLPRDQMYDPEQSIAAATRLIAELDHEFSDIAERRERIKFILASYNGGSHHIRDAMELCRRDGGNSHQWTNVSEYVLKLAQPEYYNDPIVKYGYMRGTETANYVEKICQRWDSYRGVKTARPQFSQQPRKANRSTKKYALE